MKGGQIGGDLGRCKRMLINDRSATEGAEAITATASSNLKSGNGGLVGLGVGERVGNAVSFCAGEMTGV